MQSGKIMSAELIAAALTAATKIGGHFLDKKGGDDEEQDLQVPVGTANQKEKKAPDNTGKLLDVLKPLIDGGINAGTNALFGKMQGRNAGLASKAYNDAAHPGTNAWERLGKGNSGTQTAIAGDAQRTQMKMQSRDLAMKREIAQLQANTALQQTSMTTKAPLQQASLQAAKLPEELQNLSQQRQNMIAQRLLTIQQAAVQGEIRKLTEAKAKLADETAQADLTAKQTQSIRTMVANILKDPSSFINSTIQTGQDTYNTVKPLAESSRKSINKGKGNFNDNQQKLHDLHMKAKGKKPSKRPFGVWYTGKPKK